MLPYMVTMNKFYKFTSDAIIQLIYNSIIMEKSIIYLAIALSFFQAVSCKKEKKETIPQAPIVSTNNTFHITDLKHSLWILKGYFKNGTYIAKYSDYCSCPENIGFVLNYDTDTIPYNKGKYYTYYQSNTDSTNDNQQAAFWEPVDSIFNGWPKGTSPFFNYQYTIISANKDSLVIDDGTPNTADGSYSIFINHSNLLK